MYVKVLHYIWSIWMICSINHCRTLWNSRLQCANAKFINETNKRSWRFLKDTDVSWFLSFVVLTGDWCNIWGNVQYLIISLLTQCWLYMQANRNFYWAQIYYSFLNLYLPECPCVFKLLIKNEYIHENIRLAKNIVILLVVNMLLKIHKKEL